MNKLTISFALAFFLCVLLSAVAEGAGSMNVTKLNAALTDVATTVTVASTEGWLDSDTFTVDNETIKYNGKTSTTFVNCTRGYDDSTPASHALYSKCYSSDSGVLNSALGFNVASTGSTVGALSIPIFAYRFCTTSIPHMVTWDFNWMKEGSLQYIRAFFMIISIGFVLTMSWTIMSALGGVAQSILKL
ncbi:MAG: hypothetical protein WC554_07155 [Clostridia bacterium]